MGARSESEGGLNNDDNDWRGQAFWRSSKRTKQKATDAFNAAMRTWIVAIGSRVVDVDPETEALLKALDKVIASRESP